MGTTSVAKSKNIGHALYWLSLTPLYIGLLTILVNVLFLIQLGDSFEELKFRFLFGGLMIVSSLAMKWAARSLGAKPSE